MKKDLQKSRISIKRDNTNELQIKSKRDVQTWLIHVWQKWFLLRHAHLMWRIQPIPSGVTLSKALSKLKAQSSNVSFHWNVAKKTFELWALSFELWNSIRKCHPKWDRTYTCRNIYVERDVCTSVERETTCKQIKRDVSKLKKKINPN